ncbi:hypothetical protein TELCIR_09917 [Teladorsagia circumcincta]|uniref:Glycine dehydrogenase C-terminal domain-containing protein n=1 Tax=Teladorsagia circumcincta TaxID=45464 RepID=A0A2G9UFP6_TELCI|nr:hypothetical protein TELCIR_09917 [Teladorsagia circumcincta]
MDRLVDALLSIREEIAMIERGEMDRLKNPLKMAPHTLAKVVSNDWDLPYSREMAAFPKPWCHHKTWPTVGRVDDQYGDRNLFCLCYMKLMWEHSLGAASAIFGKLAISRIVCCLNLAEIKHGVEVDFTAITIK